MLVSPTRLRQVQIAKMLRHIYRIAQRPAVGFATPHRRKDCVEEGGRLRASRESNPEMNVATKSKILEPREEKSQERVEIKVKREDDR